MAVRFNFAHSQAVALASNTDPLNNISIRADSSGRQPLSLSFSCSRRAPPSGDPTLYYINPDIYKVFMNALQGKAHLDMVANPGVCKVGDMRHCGNTRGHLWECRCDDLNRMAETFYRRLQFENEVISTIIASPTIQTAKRSQTAFVYNLAIFCSGGLVGEQILLFRLFNELRREGVSGTLNLFFMDHEYKNTIAAGGVDALMDQFLRELCGCLPPSLKVNGRFFGEAEDYMKIAEVHDNFKCHLLIGADIEGTEKVMGEIRRAACMLSAPDPIVLVRKGNSTGAPSVCRINFLGEHENCYVPHNQQPQQRRIPIAHHKPLSQVQIAAIVLSVVLLLGVVVATTVHMARRR